MLFGTAGASGSHLAKIGKTFDCVLLDKKILRVRFSTKSCFFSFRQQDVTSKRWQCAGNSIRKLTWQICENEHNTLRPVTLPGLGSLQNTGDA